MDTRMEVCARAIAALHPVARIAAPNSVPKNQYNTPIKIIIISATINKVFCKRGTPLI